jgi:predicted Zn-ribbon and HTH transcriptional regulator
MGAKTNKSPSVRRQRLSTALPIGLVDLPGCRCRCGHEWLPRERNEKPRVCPKCKSANWDQQYRQQAAHA